MEMTTIEKDLSIMVDENLTFETHIDNTINRANKLLGMIVHNIKCHGSSFFQSLTLEVSQLF